MLSSQNVVIILTSLLSFDTAAKAQEGYQVCKDLLQLSSEVLFWGSCRLEMKAT